MSETPTSATPASTTPALSSGGMSRRHWVLVGGAVALLGLLAVDTQFAEQSSAETELTEAKRWVYLASHAKVRAHAVAEVKARRIEGRDFTHYLWSLSQDYQKKHGHYPVTARTEIYSMEHGVATKLADEVMLPPPMGHAYFDYFLEPHGGASAFANGSEHGLQGMHVAWLADSTGVPKETTPTPHP